MGFFSRLLLGLLLAGAILLPVVASMQAWGVRSERDARILGAIDRDCPSFNRDPSGRCRRTHRSYFYGRSHSGGGPRSGK